MLLGTPLSKWSQNDADHLKSVKNHPFEGQIREIDEIFIVFLVFGMKIKYLIHFNGSET